MAVRFSADSTWWVALVCTGPNEIFKQPQEANTAPIQSFFGILTHGYRIQVTVRPCTPTLMHLESGLFSSGLSHGLSQPSVT